MGWLLLTTFAFAGYSAPDTNLPPAKIRISGYGLFGNRQLKRTLKTVELGGKKPVFFDPGFVEDSALIITSRLRSDGYLKPHITVRVLLEDGVEIARNSAELLEAPLPRPLKIREVRFKIKKGPLSYFKSLEIRGLQSLTEKEALSYFMETETLLHLRKNRIFTPEILRRGMSSVSEVLERKGYQEVKTEVVSLRTNSQTAGVSAVIQITQGPKYQVRSIEERFYFTDTNQPAQVRTQTVSVPYSRVWLQDHAQSLKTNLFHQGYPDVTVTTRVAHREERNDVFLLDLLSDVKSGPHMHIAEVRFEGARRSRPSVLKRRVRVQRGDLLDPVQVEEGRTRLAQLGSFESVEFRYQDADEHARDVIYRLKEGKALTVSLLFGYGSYELLRGGVEIEQANVWGLGHSSRLKLIQSFKASLADYMYTMPDLAGNNVDTFLRASGLRREEVSFTREEYGGGIGAHKFFNSLSTDANVSYNYQVLNAAEASFVDPAEGLTNTTVGAVIAELKHDRRDNPLYPRRGYKVFTTFELGSEHLGGDANFERFNLAASWHHRLGGGRYISLGISQGFVFTPGDPARDLPFNRRFFPGGENSIRGYQEGEASPLDAAGNAIGAETYSLGSVEIEQALTPKWSLVLFSDNLGFAQRIGNYPFDTGLFSVGGGLRWKTIVGPVRVEYGHNLNPRKHDPDGTLHFSLGFPF